MTVEGIYEDGNITLLEIPPVVGKARVTVTFLPAPDTPDEVTKGSNAALQRLLDFMHQGVDFGEEKFHREEMYRERLEQLEQRRG